MIDADGQPATRLSTAVSSLASSLNGCSGMAGIDGLIHATGVATAHPSTPSATRKDRER